MVPGLGRQPFLAREQLIIPQEPNSPSDDWALQALADHEGDEYYTEFESIIDDLEPDQQQEVVALMWLGRGDGTLEEWDDLLKQAGEQWNPRTANYLIAHPFLAEYLREGLDLQGYEGELDLRARLCIASRSFAEVPTGVPAACKGRGGVRLLLSLQ